MITAIYIGTERLELFEDESIVIKSSVAKIEDITKIFTDTSNDFTVPASDKNNAIFEHWYESNLINGFDARKKVPAVIELSGINFKVGKIRLNKVNFKHNQPESYSLDFFGNLVDLKDKLQDDKLTDLDLSALDFVYNSTNAKTKLQTVGDVSFSLLSKRRLLYDSVNTIETNDKQTNIYYNNNSNTSGLKTSDLTASVKQLKIIEAIESKYNFNFSRDFFGSYDFTNQFLALSGTNTTVPSQIPIANVNSSPVDPTVNGNTMLADGYGTTLDRETKSIQLSLGTTANFLDVEYNIYIESDGKIVCKKENLKGSNVIEVANNNVQGGLKNVKFFVESSQSIEYFSYMVRFRSNTPKIYRYDSGFVTTNTLFKVSKRLPDLKVIDYLKGIFKMSKLVAVPQKDGSIYINTLVNYYRNGEIYDLSDYIDYKNHTVSAGKILNEIKYNFEDGQTILNQQFKKRYNVGYGDLELSIYDENGKLIDGTKLDFKLPFEQIVYEKVIDISDTENTSQIQYGLLQNENLDFVTIKPHIHYIENKTTPLVVVDPLIIKYIPDDQTAIYIDSWNIPVHVLDTINQTYSTTFGTEFNEFDNVIINNTIYSNYHKKYIELIFNVQKREYNFKAINVPTEIVLKLNLNDVIEIRGKFYRIDSFETNTNDNNVTFKLINDREVDLIPVYPVSTDSTTITVDSTIITTDATETN
jgi:hypothetical protein